MYNVLCDFSFLILTETKDEISGEKKVQRCFSSVRKVSDNRNKQHVTHNKE